MVVMIIMMIMMITAGWIGPINLNRPVHDTVVTKLLEVLHPRPTCI